MRLFTYLGLVLRRIWAKRGMLIGLLLGATLVIALLVIVPLYEGSIASVDLKFTFRQAPAASVDITASQSTTEYDATWAAEGRGTVNRNRTVLADFYPAGFERVLSRELFFIPLEVPDWVSIADAWRAQVDDWRVLVAGALDVDVAATPTATDIIAGTIPPEVSLLAVQDSALAPPPPTWPSHPRPNDATVSRFVTSADIRDQIEIVSGSWPEPATARDAAPLRIVIGESVAASGQLEVGERIILKPFIATQDVFEIVEIAGIGRAVDPGSPLWLGTNPQGLIFVEEATLNGWTGVIPQGDVSGDPWVRPRRGYPALTATQFWYLSMDRDSVELENLGTLEGVVQSFRGGVGREGIAVSTGVPDLIERFDVRKTVFGGPILAMLALVVLGALYFLIYTASLTLEREAPELALLRARGASAWQTVGIHLAQSAVIVAGAALLAPIVARFLVSGTGFVSPMSDLTGGEALEVVQDSSLIPFVAIGTVLAFVSMGLAILPMARRRVLELRSIAARPVHTSFWQRYYIDLFLIALAGLLLFQLNREGLIDVGEDTELDPTAVAAPALFLFAGALILLRLLPFLLRGLGWFMARFRGMGSALPGWHVGRNPVPYGRLALLIWLTTGFGAFALTYAGTLDRSYDDRAAFAAGTDVRIIADEAGLIPPPEGTIGTAVARTTGSPRGIQRGAELLAIRPDEFASIVSWRSDFGADSAATALAPLRPDGTAPDLGVELPDATSAIRIDAVTVPASWAEQVAAGGDPPPPLQLMARVIDGSSRYWVFNGPPLSDTTWSTVDIPIDSALALNDGPVGPIPGPLVLQALWVEREVSGGQNILVGHVVLLDDIRAVTADGEVPLDDAIDAEFDAVSGLQQGVVDGDLAVETYYRSIPDGEVEPSDAEKRASPLFREGDVRRWVVPSRNRTGAVPHVARQPDPIRVVMEAEYAVASGLSIGEDTNFAILSQTIPGTVVGYVEAVPTALTRTLTGSMFADLDALLHWNNVAPSWSLTGNLARVFKPNELWLQTADPDGTSRQVLARLDDPSPIVVTKQGVEADFSSRPVQIGLVSILFVGAAAGVVLALAGVTGYVLIAVKRRTREMGVLRALGFQRRGVAATFAVEQLVVLGLGAVIGVGAGVALMRLLIPFLQLGESAEELVPEVLLQLNPGVLAAYLAVVTSLLVMSVVWATRSVSARELSEVLRQGDR